MVIIGIDPGSKGAACILSTKSNRGFLIDIKSTSFCGVNLIDLKPVADRINIDSVICGVEHVRGRGGWGAKQNFAFGSYFGGIISQIHFLNWQLVLVRPLEWKKAFGIVPRQEQKGQARAVLRRILPDFDQSNLRSDKIEAILIAVYIANHYGISKNWVIKQIKPKRKGKK